MIRWLVALVVLMTTALAHEHADSRIQQWIKGLTDKNGVGCCDTSDGFPAEAEYDVDTGRYRVRIQGVWYAVPDQALIEQPNRLGYAMVWYYWQYHPTATPVIRCFIPGALT